MEWFKTSKGIRQFFAQLEKENYKVQNRVLLARYRGKALVLTVMEPDFEKKLLGQSRQQNH